jgi:hypothetical protein
MEGAVSSYLSNAGIINRNDACSGMENEREEV